MSLAERDGKLQYVIVLLFVSQVRKNASIKLRNQYLRYYKMLPNVLEMRLNNTIIKQRSLTA